MFFQPFTQSQQFFTAWQQMVRDHLVRVEALSSQIAEAEQQGYERAGEAVDEWAKLMKSSLDYAQKLNGEWRKQTIEATKQASTVASGG
jgi:hypothetical protein